MKIMIDPGHGGRDPGACANGLKEKDLNLKLALMVRERLKKYKCTTNMTRTTDVYLSLPGRTTAANRWGAAYFISLHVNATAGSNGGYEDYIYIGLSDTGTTAKIRNAIHAKVAKVWTDAGRPNRGRKKANLHVLRETSMPAMLMENGFIDNAADAKLLKDANFFSRLAEAITAGLAAGLGLQLREVIPSPTPPPKPPPKPPAKPKPPTAKPSKYNVMDAIRAMQAVVGKVQLSAEEAKHLDANGDGKITVQDAILILQKIVGK